MKGKKKFLGFIALSFVAAAFGVCCLAGCGSNTTIADVEKFVEKSTTQTEMTEGFKSELIVGDAVVTQHILFGESGVEAKVVMDVPEDVPYYGGTLSAGYVEMYIKDGYLYYRASKTDKYTRFSTDSTSAEEYVDITGILESGEMSMTIQTFLSLFKEMEGNGLKITETEKGSRLTYNLSYKDTTGEVAFALIFEKISGGYKISNISLDMHAMDVVLHASFVATSEEIDFPADLEANVEEGTEGGSENEGSTEVGTGETVTETI